jgi:hypothetical protein
MRYRKLDENGDFQFGHSSADFWFNQPEAVGQSIKTRLLLFTGEWFLDTTAGTPWGGFPLNADVVRQGRVLGEHTHLSRDMAIKERVVMTEGVLGIADYSSSFDTDLRNFSVNMVVDTVYGSALEFAIMPAVAASITPNIQFEVVPAKSRIRRPTENVNVRRPPPPILARGNRWRMASR